MELAGMTKRKDPSVCQSGGRKRVCLFGDVLETGDEGYALGQGMSFTNGGMRLVWWLCEAHGAGLTNVATSMAETLRGKIS